MAKLWFLTVLVFSKISNGQINVPQNSDPCIDMAREAAYTPLQNFYPYYIYFSISLPTSRQLFRHLYTQTFTSSSFNEYCRAYESGRKEFNKCPESNLKTAVLSGYRLADFMCINRLTDFASHLPCLQTANQAATEQCRPRCTQFEQSSNSFLESRGGNNDFLLSVDSPNLVGDCKYLDCLISCRRPIFEQQCGRQAADLDWQALQITAQSTQELYDSVTTPRLNEIDNNQNGQVIGISNNQIGTIQNDNNRLGNNQLDNNRIGSPNQFDNNRFGVNQFGDNRFGFNQDPNQFDNRFGIGQVENNRFNQFDQRSGHFYQPSRVSTFPIECRRLTERFVGFYNSADKINSIPMVLVIVFTVLEWIV